MVCLIFFFCVINFDADWAFQKLQVAGVPKPPAKRAVPTKAKASVEGIEISPDTEEVKNEKQKEKLVPQNENSAGYKKKKKKVPSMTALLTARSKV